MAKKKHSPIVWQLSVLQLDKKTLISGVLLTKPPFSYYKQIGNIRNFINVFKSYFVGVYANKELTIIFKEHCISLKTDGHGSFSTVIDFLIDDIPEVAIPERTSPLRIVQSYPIVFPYCTGKIDVISDIDDTIIVSHSSSLFKRIATLAFKAPHNRKSIPFSSSLLNNFEKEGASVFYISKSESNLFGILTAYIHLNSLPQGKLFLTPYLKMSQLLNSKKGVDYKYNNIRLIIENEEEKKFILIGDDSQKDIEVYLRIVEEYPNRIMKVYIRQTKSTLSSSQKRSWSKLNSSTVPFLYFRDEMDQEVLNDIEQLLNVEK